MELPRHNTIPICHSHLLMGHASTDSEVNILLALKNIWSICAICSSRLNLNERRLLDDLCFFRSRAIRDPNWTTSSPDSGITLLLMAP
ncbi:unnamed protein product [Protopolystoma xenopodis]|uniref:Uncharacterized protein n=1 Tax=Protopolystoma xenopodis TaxID=117903 RepID=A0A3S5AL83_9PLAT|nr:unnamed protein product [Protopolystoma xenopodis]